MRLDVKNLQLCKAVSLKYIRKIFGIGYEMENYDNKAKCKCKIEEWSCKKIIRHLIVGLEKYNIQ